MKTVTKLHRYIVTSVIAIALGFNGCALYDKYVSKDDQAKLSQAVLDLAHSTLDGIIKNNFQQSAGDLLRSLESSAVAFGQQALAPVLQQQLQKWLGAHPQLAGFSNQLADLINAYVKSHGNNPAAVNEALEAAATALNTKTV